MTPRSRGANASELCQQHPRNRGSRECRVRDAPIVSRAKSRKHTRSSPQVHRSNRHSPRNGFNALLRDLPGDRALLSPSSCEYGWSAPGRADFASAKLDASVEASGPHDFAVRGTIVRLRAADRSRVGPRPAITIARRRCRVHRIPYPTSVTIAKRPSRVGRDGGDIEVIWGRREPKNFCEQDWTTQITLIQFNKFACARTPGGGLPL